MFSFAAPTSYEAIRTLHPALTMLHLPLRALALLTLLAAMLAGSSPAAAEDLPLTLRYQQETSPGSGRWHTLTREESWPAEKTAIIVCDMWDLHHCKNAVLRETEFAPRLNQLLKKAREQGVTIIHAPSDCMQFYADHPARKRAIETPKAAILPADIGAWCKQIPAEEKGVYPIDQTQGGEDDDPAEHAAWAKELAAKGLDPRRPWTRQTDMIDIDAERDYISDRGEEVWSILDQKGVDHVILSGVHTNMCVLGRPFGLRQMAKNGKHAALLRDMTDPMYDPDAWPYVSHFTGADLIVSHIEKYVCPTITSDQFLGGKPFRFSGDKRPHVAIVSSEAEYETEKTLPEFAANHLGKECRVSLLFGSEEDPNSIPGLEVLDDADILLVSVRRRVLPPEELKQVREFVQSGKPVIGIRTASHAFTLRNEPPPEGHAAWPEFDAQVFGGNYTNHHGNKLSSTVYRPEGVEHEILEGVPEAFPQAGSLYKTSPLKEGAVILLMGRLDSGDAPPEPVAWVFERADGGHSFYTSLGHRDDFAGEAFPRLLKNAIDWAAKAKAR
jgi:nicotinamidase-related amidase/type 1 glutamine amidotransferase